MGASSFAAGQAQANQSAAAAPQTTIHVSSNLVTVDVTVVDAHQNPVHQLKQDDFKIYEDGKAQTVRNFEEHVSGPVPPITPIPKLDPGTFTNFTPTPAKGALTILLIDELNTPIEDQTYVRNQLLKYLKDAKPGTQVAVFGLTTRLYLLQGFTADLDRLRTMMASSKTLPNPSAFMESTSALDPMAADNSMIDSISSAAGNSPSGQAEMANIQRFEEDVKTFRLQAQIRYTLDGLNQLARFLGNLPGRKNLIWFSGSFPINVLPDGSQADPFAVMLNLGDEFKDTVTRLGRSQVAVYPIDARGLRTDPMYDDENGARLSTTSILKSHIDFNEELSNDHSTMTTMAEATGGKAFVNANDLAGSVEKVTEAGSNFYTVSYIPTNTEMKGGYRKIKVDLDRKGVSLAYRRGYYADDFRDKKATTKLGSSSATTGPEAAPYSALNAAMTNGAPEPTEIIFLASARPQTADPETEAAQGNKTSPKVKGPFRRYAVRYNASASNVVCPVDSAGIHYCSLEFVTLVYGPDGALINSQTNAIKAGFTAARYSALLNGGIQYRQQISVPSRGDYTLRVGLMDLNSGHIGAVELPVAAVAKLTPVSATAPPAQPAAPAAAKP